MLIKHKKIDQDPNSRRSKMIQNIIYGDKWAGPIEFKRGRMVFMT